MSSFSRYTSFEFNVNLLELFLNLLHQTTFMKPESRIILTFEWFVSQLYH